MKLHKVTYAKTFNLGNYENERIEVEAEVEEGEEYQEVLDSLKGLVSGGDVNSSSDDGPEPVTLGKPYLLRSSSGQVLMSFNTEAEWLNAFDGGYAKTANAREFYNKNSSVLEFIRKLALKSENPRPLARLNEVEAQYLELF